MPQQAVPAPLAPVPEPAEALPSLPPRRWASPPTHSAIDLGDGRALICDIGGGSTDPVRMGPDGGEPRIKCWWSGPWGVVSVTDSEGRNFATVEERLAAYGRMRERVRHAFRHFMDLLPK